MESLFLGYTNKHAPIVNIKVKGNNIPFVTPELKSMIRQIDYLRAKANKTGSCILRQAYNQIKTKVSRKFYSSRKHYYNNKIEQHKDDMKNTWKILNHAIGRTHKTVGIDKVSMEGIAITDKKQIVERCNEHFVSIGQKLASDIENTDAHSSTARMKPVEAKFSFKPISVPQVIMIIKKLLNSKATGIQGIPNKTLKETADIIDPSLTDIFNFSVLTKVFPDDLKIGKVAPVYKSGDRDDLNNYMYHPISVLPTMARVFEKILYGQVYEYFTSNKLSGNEQFGFRTLHSTALALGNSSSNWWLNMDKGKLNSVVFLDIQKAFDTVNHKILLDKLNHYGIRDEELSFFSSYLHRHTQCCSVNEHKSTFSEITWSTSGLHPWATAIYYLFE